MFTRIRTFIADYRTRRLLRRIARNVRINMRRSDLGNKGE